MEKVLVDELLGLEPLEELLADKEVSDIMVNGPNQTYIERKGKLELANIKFREEEHLFQVAQRIVNRVDRNGVVWGKRVSVGLGLGGSRRMKRKKKTLH